MEPADRGDMNSKAAPVGRLRFRARGVRERSRPQRAGHHQRAIERIVFTGPSSQGGGMAVKGVLLPVRWTRSRKVYVVVILL
jgi:hypothetical protein